MHNSILIFIGNDSYQFHEYANLIYFNSYQNFIVMFIYFIYA